MARIPLARTVIRRIIPRVTTTTAASAALRLLRHAASRIDDILLRPLPFPHPQQLVWLREDMGFPGPFTGPDFLAWRKRNHTLQGMALLANASYNLTGGGRPGTRGSSCLGSRISSAKYMVCSTRTSPSPRMVLAMRYARLPCAQ